MTYQSKTPTCRHRDGFEIQRSQLIDQFAGLELSICRCLVKFSSGADWTSPLSQKLKKLGTVEATSSLSKERAIALKALAQTCVQPLKLRANIVHAKMVMGDRDGEPVAMFQNVADAAQGEDIYLVQSIEQLLKLGRDMQALTAKFDSFTQQSKPSSPAKAGAHGPT